ncbi:hypothetical protein, variant 2 [Aphanomyces invadans]|nr:hypothetical protein, variant 2 [Aphanomyces invadans]ETW02764.1 hypothetical protein, variant 2 [Aphanomyces invadans]RHY30294.1 hypothetical protein DYB32_004437 [Aphanomyces invadans]|eukprot:XP_008868148.1 hypothetical protein, variant 2 [Aphanomyces invadans]
MLSVETLTEIAGPSYSLDLQKRILGMPSHEWTRIVIDELNLTMSPDDLAHAWHTILGTKVTSSVLLPGELLDPVISTCSWIYRSGALDLVQSLKNQPNVKVALATSSTSKAVAIKRSVHPALFEAFEVIVCGDDPAVVHGKPSPDIFLAAATRLGIADTTTCVVVEDSPNGVKAGRAAGMQVVAVPDGRFYDEVGIAARFTDADIVLRSLEHWHTAVFQ